MCLRGRRAPGRPALPSGSLRRRQLRRAPGAPERPLEVQRCRPQRTREAAGSAPRGGAAAATASVRGRGRCLVVIGCLGLSPRPDPLPGASQARVQENAAHFGAVLAGVPGPRWGNPRMRETPHPGAPEPAPGPVGTQPLRIRARSLPARPPGRFPSEAPGRRRHVSSWLRGAPVPLAGRRPARSHRLAVCLGGDAGVGLGPPRRTASA